MRIKIKEDERKQYSVSLTKKEIDEIKDIADKYEVSQNYILRRFIRDGLKSFKRRGYLQGNGGDKLIFRGVENGED